MLLAARRVLTAEQAQKLRDLRPKPAPPRQGLGLPTEGQEGLPREDRVGLLAARPRRLQTVMQTDGPVWGRRNSGASRAAEKRLTATRCFTSPASQAGCAR